MALFEKITAIIRDMRNDTDHIARDLEDQYKTRNELERLPDSPYRRHDRRSDANSNAVWILVMPNILGFALGLAVCRFLVFHGWWYLVFGVIGALGVGTFKNVEDDKLSLSSALLRNGIIVGGIALIFALTALIGRW